MGLVETFRGPTASAELGSTLMHEHVFVRNPELEVSLPDSEWDAERAVDSAVDTLSELYELGVRTVVDLTVPGLGRDVRLVARVAERVPVNLIAATGWYSPDVLPTFFRFHGPGLLIGGVDPLIEMFVKDIRIGIGGTDIRAGLIKVMTDVAGFTPDVTRVLTAAAVAHQETGVAITTHSHPASRNGIEQQRFLLARGVPADRIIIGHSGDTSDIAYLRALMDEGSTIGMDRFGMEHVLADDERVHTVVKLLELGYVRQMVLSHDAAVYSHVTPPSWRAVFAPRWRMDTLHRHVIPMLYGAGVPQTTVSAMLIDNPRKLLEKAA
jgi:phosphotriesterase-related protein